MENVRVELQDLLRPSRAQTGARVTTSAPARRPIAPHVAMTLQGTRRAPPEEPRAMGAGRLEGTASFDPRARVFSQSTVERGHHDRPDSAGRDLAGLGRDRPIVSPALTRSSVRKRPRLALVSRSSRAHPPSPRPRPRHPRRSRSSEKTRPRIPERRGASRERAEDAVRLDASADAYAHTSNTELDDAFVEPGASLSNLARCPRRAWRRRRTRRRRSCRRAPPWRRQFPSAAARRSRRGPRAVPGPLARRHERGDSHAPRDAPGGGAARRRRRRAGGRRR